MMPKPVLVIDIGRESLRAGVFSQKAEPLDFFMEPILVAENGTVGVRMEVKDSLTRLLSDVRARGYKEFASVLAGIPPHELSMRVVELPFEDMKKIREVLPFELAGLLHVNVEDSITDAVPLGDGKVLAFAVEKNRLRDYIEVLDSLGLDPAWAGSALFSIPGLLNDLYGSAGTKAFISPDYVAAVKDGTAKFLNPLRRAEAVRLALTYLEGEDIYLDSVYFTGWDESALKGMLPGLALELIELPYGYPPDGAGVYAIARQLRKGAEEQVNLRRGELKYMKERVALGRGLKVTAAIALALVLILLGDAYMRYLKYSGELNALRSELRSSYLELFPGEKPPADEVYMLETKLAALDKEADVLGGGVDALNVMNAIASGAKGEGIRITELNIAGGRVTAKGEAPDFEAPERARDALLKTGRFREAIVTDVKSRPGGGVTFSFLLTLS